MEAQTKASVYFSFAQADEKMVYSYADALQESGYRILMPDNERRLSKQYSEGPGPQDYADGTLLFLTGYALESNDVGEEVRKAIGLLNRETDRKFFIPLVLSGVPLPGELEGIQYIPVGENLTKDTLKMIIEGIESFMRETRGDDQQRNEPEISESDDPRQEDSSMPPGTDIRSIQTILRDLKFFSSAIDGRMGPVTRKAIQDFQKKMEMEPTGNLDPATVKALTEARDQEKNATKDETARRFSFLSRLDTDAPSADIPDALDFESDINALASVIAFKEVEPPLAIGLFGNWGTGKSFFMNKLQKRIKKLSETKVEEYCRNVVSINFNSWHYSDSNLWASLITKIFEDLEKYGKGEDDRNKLNTLLENLNSAKELLEEKTQEQEKLKKELEELGRKRTDWTREIDKAVSDLDNIKTTDIIREVWKDPGVRKDVEALEKRYDFLELKEYGQIEKNLEELGDGMSKFKETLKLIYSFRKGKLWIALAAAAGIFGLFTLLSYWAGSMEELFDQLKYVAGIVAALTSQIVFFLQPMFKKLGGVHERLVSLKKTCDMTAEKERQTLMQEMDGLNKAIAAKKALKEEIDEKIKKLEMEKIAVDNELTDIRSGRKIMRFIEGRVTDQRYINSLGIISWIRKDFEELDFLLKQQYDAKKLKELNREMVENVFKVDRIVLYIDDLDRCEVSTVVRVLEAIHLLLAFPLFVVVVGVDPRWMHNALNIKYEKFLKKRKSDNNGHPMPAEEEDTYYIDHPATSFDYLEKIFQIPFVLKPINETGKKQLIRDQFVKKQEVGEGEGEKGREGEGEKGREVMQATGGEDIAEGESHVESNLVQSAMSSGNKTEMERNGSAEPVEEFQGKDREAEQLKEEMEELENVTRLQVSDEEVLFMQRISFLIGESPRTIKRHINIYRLIRSHSLFKTLQNKELEYYQAAMIILGILTGVPHLSRSLFTAIKGSKDNSLFRTFLSSYMKDQDPESPVLKNFNERLAKEKDLGDIGDLKMKAFKENLSLISRFTFRNLS